MFKKTNNVNAAENTNKAIDGLINCSKNVALGSAVLNAGILGVAAVGGKTGLIAVNSATAEKLAKILSVNIFVSAGAGATYIGGKVVKKIAGATKKAKKVEASEEEEKDDIIDLDAEDFEPREEEKAEEAPTEEAPKA